MFVSWPMPKIRMCLVRILANCVLNAVCYVPRDALLATLDGRPGSCLPHSPLPRSTGAGCRLPLCHHPLALPGRRARWLPCWVVASPLATFPISTRFCLLRPADTQSKGATHNSPPACPLAAVRRVVLHPHTPCLIHTYIYIYTRPRG